MGLRVTLYCPDRHIAYDGRTPDERGVGGGITARVRMARALARAGHEVTQVVNCPGRECIDGVEYVPLREGRRIEADVLILNTSGGDLDLTPALGVDTHARLRIVWAHGTTRPAGLDRVSFDCLYAVSNFVASIAQREWALPLARIFVAYNGFEEGYFDGAERDDIPRDPFRLAYVSHPSKGLSAAKAVLRILRRANPRFHLVVFGGRGLWGDVEAVPIREEGVEYRGLIGQRDLATELERCAFSLNLQTRLEPFGMALLESLRAGCLVVASPVGAFREMVENGRNGFLIPGDPGTEEVQAAAAEQVLSLSRDPSLATEVHNRARSVPWSSDVMAATWSGHWDWWLGGRASPGEGRVTAGARACPRCGTPTLQLADGGHCVECSWYGRDEAQR
jgi:glycosyltransferase involved in cell wall biosynthesis